MSLCCCYQGVLKHYDIVLYLNELYILQAVKSVMWLWRHGPHFLQGFLKLEKTMFHIQEGQVWYLQTHFNCIEIQLFHLDTSWPKWTGQMPINTLRVHGRFSRCFRYKQDLSDSKLIQDWSDEMTAMKN